MEPAIVVSDVPHPDAAKLIGDGLNALNDEKVGYSDRQALTVLANDPDSGELLGGIIGRSSLGLLFIDLVWLPERLRGTGIGTRMLNAAEAEGRRRGCRSVVLYTISFQAPGFYARQGYRVFGEIPCDPPGTSRVFMTKEL